MFARFKCFFGCVSFKVGTPFSPVFKPRGHAHGLHFPASFFFPSPPPPPNSELVPALVPCSRVSPTGRPDPRPPPRSFSPGLRDALTPRRRLAPTRARAALPEAHGSQGPEAAQLPGASELGVGCSQLPFQLEATRGTGTEKSDDPRPGSVVGPSGVSSILRFGQVVYCFSQYF